MTSPTRIRATAKDGITEVRVLMQQAGFLEKIGKENVMENLNNAILRSRELLKRDLDLPTLIVPS